VNIGVYVDFTCFQWPGYLQSITLEVHESLIAVTTNNLLVLCPHKIAKLVLISWYHFLGNSARAVIGVSGIGPRRRFSPDSVHPGSRPRHLKTHTKGHSAYACSVFPVELPRNPCSLQLLKPLAHCKIAGVGIRVNQLRANPCLQKCW